MLAAPPPDAAWAYRSSRAADPRFAEHRLEFGGHVLDLAETAVAFEVDEQRQEVHVQVHNPAYRKLPDAARAQVTFLQLDWLLGEDGVERWVGRIEFPKKAPRRAVPASELVAVIEAMAAQARDREPEWALMTAESAEGVTFVTARRPLKWIEYPLLDRHVEVALAYQPRARDDSGLPDNDELARLRELEDGLLAVAGDAALLAAH